MTRAAVYTRVSSDRDGESKSPARQFEAGRRFAEARGWEVVTNEAGDDTPYCDRNITGFGEARNRRPGFNALRAAVRAGEVQAVIVSHLDRLGRNRADLIEFPEFLRQHRCAFVVLDMNVDTTTAAGRMAYSTMAVTVSFFSDLQSEKIADAVRRNVQNGEVHGGGSRQFGYDRKCRACTDPGCRHRKDLVPVPEEAKVIKELARRALRGESLYALATDLNERGVRTTNGNRWAGTTLSQMLRSPKLAALRRDGAGVVPGNWKPVLPERTWRELVAELDGRKNVGGGRAVPAHLLTGLIRCGSCGQRMGAAHFRQGNGTTFDRYQCKPGPDAAPCERRVAASKAAVDRVVTETFFNFMAATALRPVDAPAEDAESELLDVKRRLNVLLQLHLDGELDADTFKSQNASLRQRKVELNEAVARRATAEAARATALRPGKREDVVAWWEAASLEDRRKALADAIDEVVVMPAKRRGGNVFDDNRVRIEWSNRVYQRIVDEGRGWYFDPTTLDHPALPETTRRRFAN